MADARPTLWELNRYFLMLGATGFGGPVTLANYMRRDLVEALHWLSEEEYDRGLAIATACPGPLAYQLGVYCGYVTHGVPGGILVGLSFALAPFIIVTAAAIVYVHYAATDWIRGLFYGIGPVVVALILKACLNLGTKTLKRETSAWIVAVVAVFITVLVKKELIGLFLAAGALGIFIFKPHQKPVKPVDPAPSAASPTACITAAPLFLGLMPAATSPAVLDLFLFFFRTGLLVFGSGLVIVSFVKTYVVDQYHWMNDRAFLDAVAIGLVSPGPVVMVGAPVVRDWLTALPLVFVLLAPRLRKGIPDQALVAAGAVIGLIAFPLLRPNWMVH